MSSTSRLWNTLSLDSARPIPWTGCNDDCDHNEDDDYCDDALKSFYFGNDEIDDDITGRCMWMMCCGPN